VIEAPPRIVFNNSVLPPPVEGEEEEEEEEGYSIASSNGTIYQATNNLRNLYMRKMHSILNYT